MFARTARLLLRPGWAEDAPALAAAIGDELIVRNLATAPWPYRLRDAEAFLAQPRDPLLPSFLIFERTDGEPRLLGSCGLGRRPSGGCRAGLLGRAPVLGPRDCHRGFKRAARYRPDPAAAAPSGLALPRQSGVRPGAREAGLRTGWHHRSADELRARRGGAGPADAAYPR